MPDSATVFLYHKPISKWQKRFAAIYPDNDIAFFLQFFHSFDTGFGSIDVGGHASPETPVWVPETVVYGDRWFHHFFLSILYRSAPTLPVRNPAILSAQLGVFSFLGEGVN